MGRQKLTWLIFMLGLFLPLSFVSAGTIVSPFLYAWSNNVGYINFAQVAVGDSALTGYAWSANSGWINFSPAKGGVTNDGTGNLSGSAWGEQLGWIDFDGVSIDGSSGRFSGSASGTLIGTLNFDCPNYCDVETDWRSSNRGGGDNDGSGGGKKKTQVGSTAAVASAGTGPGLTLDSSFTGGGQPTFPTQVPSTPAQKFLGIFQNHPFLFGGAFLLISILLIFLGRVLLWRRAR